MFTILFFPCIAPIKKTTLWEDCFRSCFSSRFCFDSLHFTLLFAVLFCVEFVGGCAESTELSDGTRRSCSPRKLEQDKEGVVELFDAGGLTLSVAAQQSVLDLQQHLDDEAHVTCGVEGF